MKKTLLLIASILLIVYAISQAVGPVHKYIGAVKCKLCHTSDKSGKAYPIWQKTKHAAAYTTLASPEALEVGKKLGIETPQNSEKCLVCHITAFSVEKDAKDSTLTLAEGISCEACHGPGSDYKAMAIMKDKQKAIAAGLIIPNEKTCVTCHNEKSPTYKPFKYAEMFKLIAHPLPKETAPIEKKG
jgi:hypothetical protein